MILRLIPYLGYCEYGSIFNLLTFLPNSGSMLQEYLPLLQPIVAEVRAHSAAERLPLRQPLAAEIPAHWGVVYFSLKKSGKPRLGLLVLALGSGSCSSDKAPFLMVCVYVLPPKINIPFKT